tara:strand:- start:2282 stop:5131 length:2850 start_codon:yes stop_codon:yes gene_type:complete
MEANGLYNSEYVGGQFFWWIGQVVDSKDWRDNLTNKGGASVDDNPGWGYRYKVRIMGCHDKTTVPNDKLHFCQVINSVWGGGEGASFQTPGIRQGSFVIGFFLDGINKNNPIIFGVLGNDIKYRAAVKGIKAYEASSGYDETTDNQCSDHDKPTTGRRSFNSAESYTFANGQTASDYNQLLTLKHKTHVDCVYKPDSTGGIQVAVNNLTKGLTELQRGISDYPSAISKAEGKINKLLDKHLGKVTSNMNKIMGAVELFSSKSLVEKAGILLNLADTSQKKKLTKAQQAQRKALSCMFGALSKTLGGKVRKAIKNKLMDNLEPTPEGYYIANNPCFTEAIIADVMSQSLDEITDTMDSANKNFAETASGFLGGLSNLSASALIPTGLLSGIISQNLGALGSGLNLGGAMSFISGLASFFACLPKPECSEYNTIDGQGDPTSTNGGNLDNAANLAKDGKIDENTLVDLNALGEKDFEQVGGKIMTDKESGKKIYVPKTYDEYNTLKNSGKLDQAIFLSERDLSDIRKENNLASIAVKSGNFEEVTIDGKTLLKSTKKIIKNNNEFVNPQPGDITTAPNGKKYVFFGNSWGPAEGVISNKKEILYNDLEIKPETSHLSAINKVQNNNQDKESGVKISASNMMSYVGTKGFTQPLSEIDISDQLKEEQFTKLLIDSGQWEQTEINGEKVLQEVSESIFKPNLNYGDLTENDFSKIISDSENYFAKALDTKSNIPFSSLNYGELSGGDFSEYTNPNISFNIPNALDTKISEDDQRWLDSKENLVNIAQILKPLGVPSDFAKYAIQYAKGDDTPITSFSAGTRKAIETIVLRKYKNNPSLFANGKKVQINYGDYGQENIVEALRFPNVRLGLGTFTVSVNDQGLINVTDTFNVQQDFKGTYAFSGVPTLEDSASRIVDIAHKVRGVSPGQEDKGGIPINVTFSSNKLKKEIEGNK